MNSSDAMKRRHRAYIVSFEWKDRRERYYVKHGRERGYHCCVKGCAERHALQLNHLSYAHSGQGQELDEELCWLCDEHHVLYHQGLIKITVQVQIKQNSLQRALKTKKKYRTIVYQDTRHIGHQSPFIGS